jgi:hypothetical protein
MLEEAGRYKKIILWYNGKWSFLFGCWMLEEAGRYKVGQDYCMSKARLQTFVSKL